MALLDSIFPLRELREGELESLSTRSPAQQTSLTAIKSSHFRIARLVAQGLRSHEVASQTGFSVATINSLRNNNPAFQALVEEYQEAAQQESLDVIQRMTQVGTLAVEELGDRLSEAPSEFSNRELLEVARDMLPQARVQDSSPRTVPGPVTIQFVSAQPQPEPKTIIIEGEKQQ